MKKMKKAIALFLAVLCLSSLVLVTPVFAEDAEPAGTVAADSAADETTTFPEHPEFEDVSNALTGDDGRYDWKKMPGSYLKIFSKIRIIEVLHFIFQAIKDLFSGFDA